jgi:hypothetical protein
VLVRVRVGRLRAGEITAQPAHLAHLVVRVGHGEHVDADHVLAGAERLPFGLLPGAAHLQHLRVVHPADARVERGQWQRVAPAAGRVRPLGRPPQVTQLVARVHQAAVDRARPEQGELVGQRGHHGLVQQREPLGHPGLFDADAPLEVHAERGERRVLETPAEVLHAARPGERTVQVAGAHVAGDAQVEHVPLLGALVHLVEQALRPAEPARALRRLADQPGVDRQQERGPTGTAVVVLLEMTPIGLGVPADGLVHPAQPDGGLGEGLEIGGGRVGQRGVPVVRRLPVPAPSRRTRLLSRRHP